MSTSNLFVPYRTTGVVVGASAEQLCLQSLGESERRKNARATYR